MIPHEIPTHTDPVQNIMGRFPQPLDAIFLPRSIALIGAKDTIGSVGRTILVNLQTGSFKGRMYPVNPNRASVLGLKAYPDVTALPEVVDLAVIVTPAATVPNIVAQCVQSGIKAAIIISAGFKELGPPGLALEEEILLHAKKGKMRIIGPNCLGVMNPIYGMNATFAKGMALPGNIAFISQSGAMLTAVLDWSFQERIGFSSFVSVGSMADVNWGDLISYLGEDAQTHSILIYMETIGNPRSFLTAAREIALEKPIIVIKPGRSQAAAKAAASHTGSLAGSDEVFDAALQRVGVLRVNSIAELFRMASVLSRQPKPRGPRLSIVTNAGGPSVLATDMAVLAGADLAPLEAKTILTLNESLPPAWSHSNPVDILGDAGPERYSKAIEALAQDSTVDGILVVLSPQDVTDPMATAECLRPYAHSTGKPVLASWMGGSSVSKGIEMLSQAGIPAFSYPDDAAWTFATMWQYSENLQRLYETPAIRDEGVLQPQSKELREGVKVLIEQVRKQGRTLLNEFESKQVLAAYDIPVVETKTAETVEQAVEYANQMRYPVVLKLFSETITHKTDVGGVKLNLKTPQEVAKAFHEIKDAVAKHADARYFQGVTVQRMVKLTDGYELILGSTTDAQFGPVLLFGTGGQLVEVFKDRALALPPLNCTLARHLMQKTKIYEALQGVRGREPVNLVNLELVLTHFSQLIVDNPFIKECDINPLLASPEEIVALDARIVLHEPYLQEQELPQIAIRPYPINYVKTMALKNGEIVTLRPIRPEDELLMIGFHKELSETSVRQRYFAFVSLNERVTHERLIRICFNDYDREWAIVAEIKNPSPRIIGAARLSRLPGINQAQFTMLISDAYHNKGLGTAMLKHLLAIAKNENIDLVHAHILSENEVMIKLCKSLGFQAQSHEDPLITSMYVVCVYTKTNT